MRVAFVSLVTDPLWDAGATRRTRRLAEGLADAGHDVSVFCAQWWEGRPDSFDRNGVTYRRVVDVPATGSFTAGLPLALARERPDVVHAVNSPPAPVLASAVAATLLRVPVVVDWWADKPTDSAAGYRRAARVADAVTVPSRTTETRVREHGAPAGAIRVLPESVDMSLVREAPTDARADVVYARDLDEAANVESFLLALAELRDRDWRAAVVGDGPARPEIEQTARDLRIDDRIEFLGDLPMGERVPIYKGAHVFAQTALRESFATNLLWALACGCVGIVEYQAQSSAHELVEGRDRGVRVTDPEELADEIASAAAVERATVNGAFAEFDRDAVRERQIECYRRAGAGG